jgi:CheY-like chemotaxis protein
VSHILIVDDSVSWTYAIAHALGMAGYTVRTAAGGAEALALARAARPDLVLMDLIMAGVDGSEMLRHLRADPATRAVPVVIVTAMTDPWLLAEAGQLGVVRILVKSRFGLDELRAVVRDLLPPAPTSSAA